ncbi:MAG: thioredoxin fold domain-containing protein [Oceanospirillaceae bacterium]
MPYKKNITTASLTKIFSNAVTALLLLGVSSMAMAQTTAELIQEKLNASRENIQVESVVESPWIGMYEVTLKSGAVLFSDKNAQYFVLGQMLQLNEGERIVNLSEQKFQKQVASELAAVPSDQQIIYKAIGEQKASVTVFTDITCYYCQKLHKAIPELQENGVTVKYMAFPRAGLKSEVAQQMSAIWCAKDNAKALTDAKRGNKVHSAKCDDPVAEQFLLGQQIGVNATPTLFTEEGVKIAGFASAESLLQDLNINQ